MFKQEIQNGRQASRFGVAKRFAEHFRLRNSCKIAFQVGFRAETREHVVV